jgi:hypothetical protein
MGLDLHRGTTSQCSLAGQLVVAQPDLLFMVSEPQIRAFGGFRIGKTHYARTPADFIIIVAIYFNHPYCFGYAVFDKICCYQDQFPIDVAHCPMTRDWGQVACSSTLSFHTHGSTA